MDYKKLFNEINPDYWERDYIKAIPEGEVATELLLRLEDFDESVYDRKLPDVKFEFFDGPIEELNEAVMKVDPDWIPIFENLTRVYCGKVDGKIVSFLAIEDFGEHECDGVIYRFGGPGCVGTVPEYRNRGIGLVMVRNITKLLREEGFDYSYINYTHEAAWYQKLGYEPILKWDKHGFVD